LIEIINKQLLLQLVGYLCYWQMGFNSVFKGLNPRMCHSHSYRWSTDGGGDVMLHMITAVCNLLLGQNSPRWTAEDSSFDSRRRQDVSVWRRHTSTPSREFRRK